MSLGRKGTVVNCYCVWGMLSGHDMLVGMSHGWFVGGGNVKASSKVVSIKRSSSLSVPVSKSRNIPEVVLVRRWAIGVLGIWRRVV